MAEQKRGPGRPPGSKNKNTGAKSTAKSASAKKSTAKAGKSASSAKKDAKTKAAAPADPNAKMVRNDIASIVLLAVGIFLIIALQTHLAGAVGTFIGGFLKGCFGFGAYFLPYFLILYVILAMVGGAIPFRVKTAVLLLILFLGVDLINAGRFLGTVKFGILGIKDVYEQGKLLENGGVFGMYAGGGLYDLVGKAGLYIVAVLIILIVLMLLINTPISAFFEKARERKALRAERKELKREEERIAAQKEAALEAEKAAKKAEVAKAGRQTSMDYKPLSDIAEQMAAPEEELKRRPPKSNYAKDFRKLPDNKKNILQMVQDGDHFGESDIPDGFGLDDTVPDHIGVGYPHEKPVIVPFREALAMEEAGKEKDNKAMQWQSFAPDAASAVTEEDLFGTPTAQTGSKASQPYAPVEQIAPISPEEAAARDDAALEQGSHHWGFLDDSKMTEGPYRPRTEEAAAPAAEQTAAPQTPEQQTPAAEQQASQPAQTQPAQTAAPAQAQPAATQAPAQPHRAAEFEVGGDSVATAASLTESQDSVVDATPDQNVFYSLPPASLLKPIPKRSNQGLSRQQLQERAELLESTLESFGVNAKVVNVIAGPSVTRYEVEPARGVKVSSITNLSDDLALSMRARSIRIEAPIPGKAAVGIEIENEQREMVGIREIIESEEFQNHKSKLAFTVGRDIGGKAVVADIAKMPHMLIAGATGSGKSVCINSIIISLLYKAKPEEVKLIMVDPKMVELGNYNGIPHLMIPVVTDPTKASAALQWAVSEMTDRYKKFAKAGVRDIGAYNAKMKKERQKGEILPQIVIIIDEMADLMMVASSQVEDAICRLAQLARAAGMHLILATQRPSVNVITGLIKANIPSRIAFMVSSQVDSRTIIDMAGAEKLVGNGDMLFKPQDLNKPKRIQGPFVSDEEVEKVIAYVKRQGGEAHYDEALTNHLEKGTAGGFDDDEDELIMDAIETVVDAGQASVSMLQRRFRIGYNRAARIIDALEARGIIGPADGSRPRQVLLSEEEFRQMKENL